MKYVTYKKRTEKEVRDKYNTDKLFRKPKEEIQNFENTTIKEETAVVEYKEKNFIKRILDKIKKVFIKQLPKEDFKFLYFIEF